MDKVNFKSFSIPPDAGLSDIDENDFNQTTQTETEGEINELFQSDASVSESAEPAHPLGLTINAAPLPPGTAIDQATGELVKDESANPYYVPSLQDVQEKSKKADIPLRLKDVDTIKQNYETKLKEFQGEKSRIAEKLELGEFEDGGVDYYKQLLTLVDEAIAKTEKAISEIPNLRSELKNIYAKEYQGFKAAAVAVGVDEFNKAETAQEKSDALEKILVSVDVNGDNWIGEPEMGIKIIRDTDKGTVLWQDGKYITTLAGDGSPVTQKWFDPSYQWTVSAGNNLKLKSEAIGCEDAVMEVQKATCEQNSFGAPIDFAVPEYITVKVDEDGIPAVREDSEDGEMHLIPMEFVTTTNGISQKPIDDMEDCMQVRIASVEIFSEEMEQEGVEQDDEHHQIVRLWTANGEIATQFRITGKNGGAASGYGFALNGSQRKESVVIDASAMKSTGQLAIDQAKLKQLYKDYDVDEFLYDDGDSKKLYENKKELAKIAFKETMDKFNATNTAVDDPNNVTGIMVQGITGYVKGADGANNIVFFEDPSKLHKAVKEGSDKSENPLFKNVFVGNGNYNAVFAKGGGDLFASEITLAWRDEQTAKTITNIAVNSKFTQRSKDAKVGDPLETTNTNAFVFLHGQGEKLIHNQSDTTGPSGDLKPHTKDDYFDTDGSGQYLHPLSDDEKLGDPDADNDLGGKEGGALDRIGVSGEGDKIIEELSKLEAEADELDPTKDFGDPAKYGGEEYGIAYRRNDTFFSDAANYFGWSSGDEKDEVGLADLEDVEGAE